jgi:phosphatidylglycerophosphate synthase
MREDVEARRPIPARSTGWAKSFAGVLARAGVAPNHVSLFGIAVMAFGTVCVVLSRDADGATRIALLLAGAASVVVRAGCNMFDGMVAIEFGRGRRSGAVFNELPDRVSDVLMLAGAGYAVPEAFDEAQLSAALGWAAAVGASLVSYVRALGGSLGIPQDFSGIMAKQQRMAVMAGAFVVTTFEGLWDGEGEVIVAALAIVIVGCAVTLVQRTARLLSRLEVQ